METDRLRYFCAIVETGSLTKASEVLGVSHGGLSKAMSVLQDELGYKVLTAKGRGLELTEQGKDLYREARKILELVSALKSRVPATDSILRIGLPEVLALTVTEALMHEIKGALALQELDSGEIETRVLSQSCDFAFTFVPFPNKELDHLKIATVKLSSFCRQGCFRGQDPEKIPYVVPASELKDNPLSIKYRDGWNSELARFTPYQATSLSIALKMVHSGLCAIYGPEPLLTSMNPREAKERRLAELELPEKRKVRERTQRDIFLVKRSSDDESKAMKTAVKIVRQVCRS